MRRLALVSLAGFLGGAFVVTAAFGAVQLGRALGQSFADLEQGWN